MSKIEKRFLDEAEKILSGFKIEGYPGSSKDEIGLMNDGADMYKRLLVPAYARLLQKIDELEKFIKSWQQDIFFDNYAAVKAELAKAKQRIERLSQCSTCPNTDQRDPSYCIHCYSKLEFQIIEFEAELVKVKNENEQLNAHNFNLMEDIAKVKGKNEQLSKDAYRTEKVLMKWTLKLKIIMSIILTNVIYASVLSVVGS